MSAVDNQIIETVIQNITNEFSYNRLNPLNKARIIKQKSRGSINLQNLLYNLSKYFTEICEIFHDSVFFQCKTIFKKYMLTYLP